MSHQRFGAPDRRASALAVAACALAATLGAAAVGLATGIAEPSIHDEFSYLLAADTFARGRLANDPHPLWQHFETFHVLQQPTYASKYPPGQGLVLMLGTLVAGHPIAGVWLSTGFMCGAICWMLLAWFPPRWALLGGLLVALRIGSAGPWAQSYWGGALAAGAGALVIGAAPRLLRHARVRDALLASAGLALLANTRPFEGAVTALGVAAVSAGHLLRGPPRPRPRALPALATLVLAGALTLALMGYYNHRVTGHALTLPYSLHHAAYSPVPLFLFQDLGETPEYRHAIFRDFYLDWALTFYEEGRDLSRLPGRILMDRLLPLWQFYVGYVGTLPFLALPWVLGDPWLRSCLVLCGIVLATTFVATFGTWPHYLAPVTGAGVALLVACLRHIERLERRGRPLGRGLVILFVAASCAGFVRRSDDHVLSPESWNLQRAALIEELEDTPENHLVLVRYTPDHSFHWDWVSSAADVDAARVVWAREMGPAEDAVLLDYFADRRAWLLTVAPDRFTLRAHPLAVAAGAPDPEPVVREIREFD